LRNEIERGGFRKTPGLDQVAESFERFDMHKQSLRPLERHFGFPCELSGRQGRPSPY
jgi:hypothetical protein